MKAVAKAGNSGTARMGVLRRALEAMEARHIRVSWIKGLGIKGNEAPDEQTRAAMGEDHLGLYHPTVVTEGELKQRLTALRKRERDVSGFGLGQKCA